MSAWLSVMRPACAAVDTPVARGALICWENYMPLARATRCMPKGWKSSVAPTYDTGEGWISTMRHIALEGRCWVLGSGTALRGSDVPDDFRRVRNCLPIRRNGSTTATR